MIHRARRFLTTDRLFWRIARSYLLLLASVALAVVLVGAIIRSGLQLDSYAERFGRYLGADLERALAEDRLAARVRDLARELALEVCVRRRDGSLVVASRGAEELRLSDAEQAAIGSG